jgi:hypothetical protein
MKKEELGSWPQVIEHLSNKCKALSSNPSIVIKGEEEVTTYKVISNIREQH